ncbi:MAG: DUF6491 family protein [Gammaproteobacteria bacterium]|nr:DUF6491 family protein [Gammaproteobacteria bacterium]MDH4314914.1 DUF6491 family protein [Gammaproteobacteria bacterium]MDH5214354.1 DUF6491 family protein [Gammaproteobacteria bacterium]MDH5621570.1 DUF6491 family protein [Gammaproteobacteria bacterium]
MTTLKYIHIPVLVLALLGASCAVSPEETSRRLALEADIQSILAHPLDPEVFGETKRCLGENEYRSYRALDDRHMLFEGRGDKLWINTLRTSCPDLRRGRNDVLVVRSFTLRRICDSDNFAVADWFDRPWYRGWGAGMTCVFGEFQPVTKDQVADIEDLLKSKR